MVDTEKYLKMLFKGKCDIYIYRDAVNEDTGATEKIETIEKENIPCRLSYENKAPAQKDNYYNTISQEILLFIGKDVEIKEGSKVVVTQNGFTESYIRSGAAAVYSGHREYVLELEKDVS